MSPAGFHSEDESTSPAADNRGAILLCGGLSTRFGADKSKAMHRGRTLLEWAIERAGSRADQIVLACGSTKRYAEYGLETATDPLDLAGPLAGIKTGLERVNRPLVLIIAVDLPFLTPRAIDQLIDAMAADPSVELVMPRTERGLEPLLLLARHKQLTIAVDKLAKSAKPAPRHLADIMRCRILDASPNPHDPLRRALTNINTPQDLAALAE